MLVERIELNKSSCAWIQRHKRLSYSCESRYYGTFTRQQARHGILRVRYLYYQKPPDPRVHPQTSHVPTRTRTGAIEIPGSKKERKTKPFYTKDQKTNVTKSKKKRMLRVRYIGIICFDMLDIYVELNIRAS